MHDVGDHLHGSDDDETHGDPPQPDEVRRSDVVVNRDLNELW